MSDNVDLSQGYSHLLEEALMRAKEDVWYQFFQQEQKEIEPAFLKIRAQLGVQQQEELDLYIAACEAIGDVMAHIAFHLGREEGMRFVITPENKE